MEPQRWVRHAVQGGPAGSGRERLVDGQHALVHDQPRQFVQNDHGGSVRQRAGGCAEGVRPAGRHGREEVGIGTGCGPTPDELGRLEPGTPLVLVESPHGLLLTTREQAERLVRESLQGADLVGEFVADRRPEAAAESGS